jgi:glucose uptake protein
MGSPRSSVSAYLSDHKGRWLAVLSGVLNASGNVCQFMAGQRAGFAAATLAQTFPLVTTLIGLAVFREFKGASRGTLALLALQICAYLASAGILATSFRARQGQ